MSSDLELEKEFEDDTFVAGTPRHRLMEARVLDDKFAESALDSDQQFFLEEILRSPDKALDQAEESNRAFLSDIDSSLVGLQKWRQQQADSVADYAEDASSPDICESREIEADEEYDPSRYHHANDDKISSLSKLISPRADDEDDVREATYRKANELMRFRELEEQTRSDVYIRDKATEEAMMSDGMLMENDINALQSKLRQFNDDLDSLLLDDTVSSSKK